MIRSSAFSRAASDDSGDAAVTKVAAPICCKNFLLEDELSFFLKLFSKIIGTFYLTQ